MMFGTDDRESAHESKSAGGQPILIHAPVGRDGQMLTRFLREQSIPADLYATLGEICAAADRAAAIILTSESLDGGALSRFEKALQSQPAWSDVPVLLLAGGSSGSGLAGVNLPAGNVTVIERPVNPAAFLTAIRSALRARRQQYLVRDLLQEAERARREAERNHAEIAALNERLQRAMTETHHRVKNNLQIIAAMVDMRAMEDAETVPTAEFRQLGSHIRVLATVHEILTADAKSGGQVHTTSARSILQRLLPLLQRTSGSCKLSFDLDEAYITVRQGTSLALIVNELVSNSAKHGADQVHLRLAVRNGVVSLTVTDNGPGFPADFDPLGSANTGLELIQHLTQWDLGGTVEFKTGEDGGGCVSLSFPLELKPDQH
jgi:two-component sensor histidine kinase